MANASDAARIKVWPGINSVLQPTLSGGGGSGYVKNITYEKYESINNDWAIRGQSMLRSIEPDSMRALPESMEG
ncbi:Uu.00g100890.m01.CDS01 [Anthostomella pinea]|uniref:Uu.00g100890.m01.CDS01 n=1 Tax=Anthostomella pinea TaxID=933095 RepID=A0AAI8YCY7_9PEZI|nr:Uu.00g100890.m01.CDS01 [Anthostomella pinea]